MRSEGIGRGDDLCCSKSAMGHWPRILDLRAKLVNIDRCLQDAFGTV